MLITVANHSKLPGNCLTTKKHHQMVYVFQNIVLQDIPHQLVRKYEYNSFLEKN